MRQPDGCMKQIHLAMQRAVENRKPMPSSKWKGFLLWDDMKYMIRLYHYHHLVLSYDFTGRKVLYEWWQVPADKRGLDDAKLWLEEYHKHTDSNGGLSHVLDKKKEREAQIHS